MSYHFVLYEAEEGGFWAEVLELPGCVAQGENIDAVRRNIVDAIEVFTEVMRDEGEQPTMDRLIGTLETPAPA